MVLVFGCTDTQKKKANTSADSLNAASKDNRAPIIKDPVNPAPTNPENLKQMPQIKSTMILFKRQLSTEAIVR